MRDLLEINDFGVRDIGTLSSDTPLSLPRYVPTIQNGSFEVPAGSTTWVAVPIARITTLVRRMGEFQHRDDLLRALNLPNETQVLLLGVGQDKYIERYWQNRRPHRDLAGYDTVARYFDAALAPNFSLFLDDPRPQHLFNRKRSLICAQEFARLGVQPIVYLHAITAHDWRFWREFLGQHTEVSLVAKEFQTGLAKCNLAFEAIDHAALLQDQVRRDLHFVAVGGAHYVETIAKRFAKWSVIDSTPFMKAAHRKAFVGVLGKRARWASARGEDPTMIMRHNIANYSAWISRHVNNRVVAKLAATGT